MAKRFSPGLRWRVLAHHRNGLEHVNINFKESEEFKFDELVVDHWFHIEQMDDRHWWIGVGDPDSDYYHVHVTVYPDKTTKVSVTHVNSPGHAETGVANPHG